MECISAYELLAPIDQISMSTEKLVISPCNHKRNKAAVRCVMRLKKVSLLMLLNHHHSHHQAAEAAEVGLVVFLDLRVTCAPNFRVSRDATFVEVRTAVACWQIKVRSTENPINATENPAQRPVQLRSVIVAHTP